VQGLNTETTKTQNRLRGGVFWPSIIIVAGAALLGVVNNQLLSDISSKGFTFSLRTFGWLYQIISIVALFTVAYLTFSKLGNIRFGGKEAKPKYSFMTWFAMALTGGIATGIVTYGVNEPIIYLSNIYGEMELTGVAPNTAMAGIYALARCFYNWTFVPYAMYSIVGALIAYMYFNKKKPLSVTSTLIPLFGDKVTTGFWADLVDTLSLLAIALGLASSLGAGLTLVGAGLQESYGIAQGPVVWGILALVIIATYTISSILGLDKGIRWFADVNAKIYYVLLAFIIIVGPTLYILRASTSGLAYWLQNFWIWGLDPIDIGGEALVMWWTLYDWAIWIAYAPLMGIFLAIISYGRTIRQFLTINWILPSVFSLIWFGVFGATAIKWQLDGSIDLAKTITDSGAVAGLWAFLGHLPLGAIFIPLLMLTLILSFSTCADSMTRTIAILCTKGVKYDEEPAMWQKLLWGLSIGLIAFFMVSYAGGSQGVDGVKYLAALGGSFVLLLFVIQVVATIKTFMFDDIVD
jgi:glycine betaine transporter